MKKVLSLALIATSLFAASKTAYIAEVKPVFLDATSSKAVGKLLPTSQVEILSEEGDRVKIRVSGYYNESAPNVIYFSPTARIFTLAFAKTAKFDAKLSKRDNGKYTGITTTVYTTKGGFEPSVKPLFDKANKLFSENCGICHALHPSTQYPANQWPSLLKSMISRTAIDKKDEWLVIQYLQKHSKDVNLK